MKGIMCSSLPGSDEEFAKKLKRRITYNIGLLFLGILTIAVSIIVNANDIKFQNDFLNGFYMGVGSGFTACGIILLIRNVHILKSKKSFRKNKIEEQDERNLLIRDKAIKAAVFLVLICIYIALLVAGIFSMVVFYTLFAISILFSIAYILMYMYYNHKL